MATLERETEQMIEELRERPEGPRFDVAFVKRMIPHHQAGIIEFLEPQSRAPHAQLRVAATSGIVNQESQVADFRTRLSGPAAPSGTTLHGQRRPVQGPGRTSGAGACHAHADIADGV